MLTPEAVRFVDRSVLCWLATCSLDGQPSVSPKEIFTHHEGTHLLIANIASPGSMKNIRGNPGVCASVLDIFTQRGVQLFGDAEVVTKSDARYQNLSEPLVAIAGPGFPFSSLFLVTVRECKPIIAPRYRLFPETTESEQVASAMRTYGVLPDPSKRDAT